MRDILPEAARWGHRNFMLTFVKEYFFPENYSGFKYLDGYDGLNHRKVYRDIYSYYQVLSLVVRNCIDLFPAMFQLYADAIEREIRRSSWWKKLDLLLQDLERALYTHLSIAKPSLNETVVLHLLSRFSESPPWVPKAFATEVKRQLGNSFPFKSKALCAAAEVLAAKKSAIKQEYQNVDPT